MFQEVADGTNREERHAEAFDQMAEQMQGQMFALFSKQKISNMVNGLLIPGRYIEQVTSPDILPPDFKNPYLSVPTHLCSLALCSPLLFPGSLM